MLIPSAEFTRNVMMNAADANPAFRKVMLWGYDVAGNEEMHEALMIVEREYAPKAEIIPFGGK